MIRLIAMLIVVILGLIGTGMFGTVFILFIAIVLLTYGAIYDDPCS